MLRQCCTQSHGVQLPGLGVGLTSASFRPQLADDWNDPPAPSCQDARAGSCHPFWGTCRHPGLPPSSTSVTRTLDHFQSVNFEHPYSNPESWPKAKFEASYQTAKLI